MGLEDMNEKEGGKDHRKIAPQVSVRSTILKSAVELHWMTPTKVSKIFLPRSGRLGLSSVVGSLKTKRRNYNVV